MDFDSALRARLLLDSAVGWIVGERVHWVLRPQGGPLPAIVLQTISDPRPQHLKGFQQLRETRVQVNCDATSHAATKQLAEVAICALVPEGEVFGVRFDRAFVEQFDDEAEETPTGFIHRSRFDLRCWWQQA